MKYLFKTLYTLIYVAAMVLSAWAVVLSVTDSAAYLYSQGAAAIAGGIAAFVAGFFVLGFAAVLLHELAHFLAGKLLGFAAVSFFVLGKEFVRSNRYTVKSYEEPEEFGSDKQPLLRGEARKLSRREHRAQRAVERIKRSGENTYGKCDLISIKEGMYRKRLILITASGIAVSFLFAVAALLYTLLWAEGVNAYLAVFLCPCLIVGAHIFLSVALPSYSNGQFNDGALVSSLLRLTDEGIVAIALLDIQTQLYMDKRPSQIDKKLFFDLPVIADNAAPAAQLYMYRYMYFLDVRDFASAAQYGKRLAQCAEGMDFCKSTAVYLCVLFDTVMAEEYKKADALYELVARDADMSDISAVRVLWFYQLKKGDKQRADKLRQLANTATAQLAGIQTAELHLMDFLSAKNQ